MLNPFKLDEYKSHKWFACDMDDGIVASGNTIKEVLVKFGRSSANFVRPKEYEFNEDTSHDRTTYSIYGDIKLLEMNGYRLNDERNTWDFNIRYDSRDNQNLGSVSAVFTKPTGELLSFESPFSLLSSKNVELFNSYNKSLSCTATKTTLVDYAKKGRELCKVLDNEYSSSFNEKLYDSFMGDLESYVNLYDELYTSSHTGIPEGYIGLYQGILTSIVYDVFASVLKSYTHFVSYDKEDGTIGYKNEFITQIDNASRGYLLEFFQKVSQRYESLNALEEKAKEEVNVLVTLLHNYLEFKNRMTLYNWAEKTLSGNKEYLKSSYSRVSVSADYLHQTYTYLFESVYSKNYQISPLGVAVSELVYRYLYQKL